MLTGQDIIIFSDDWGRHPFSCQHIMQHFLPHNRLLWVNTIGMRNPRLTLYDIKRSVEKIRSWFGCRENSQNTLPANLTIISPVMTPYNNIPLVRMRNRRSVICKVKKTMAALYFHDPILITTLPNAADYVGAFGEVFSVYYCVDEFSEWPGVEKKLVETMEKELISKVDLIVAVSERLVQTKSSTDKPASLLTHGVDLNHFHLTSLPAIGPIDLAQSPKPIIGFFGLFDERFDKKLLASVLQSHPEWSVVIIGKVTVPTDDLELFPNLHLVGKVDYQDLPVWAAQFDVCIAPYVINELTSNINPLKLKEYLATGKPVVTTAIPEAIKLSKWVSVARSHDDFIVKIEEGLSTNIDLDDRLNFLRTEGWSGKAHEFSDKIESGLEAKRIRNELSP